ncbi:MAG: nuclear transport factor 2 family protein, partial [Chloroflexi bacterium]|nr:nuclear transport factor 2 family protein [Chloroflexota bacterium]
DSRYPDGMTNADLNISIPKLDDFMPMMFSDMPVDITAQYIQALNSHDPNQVAALYTDQAVHVNPNRSIAGKEQIKAWYRTFFDQLLPNGAFTRTGFTAHGNSRTFSWTAHSDAGEVHDGNDTFGLMNDKIAYHFTHFNVI